MTSDSSEADDADAGRPADDPAALLASPPEWTGPSADPNDTQFGDVVERATLAAADDLDVVVVGEPYDGAVIGRPGAAAAPAAIREALAATKTHHVGIGPVGTANPGTEWPGRDQAESADDADEESDGSDGHDERGRAETATFCSPAKTAPGRRSIPAPGRLATATPRWRPSRSGSARSPKRSTTAMRSRFSWAGTTR